MSGLEAVPLLLSILPLFIAAVEHYHDIIAPIKRSIRFSSEAGIFLKELQTQQTIFAAHAELLLSPAVGYDAASKMVDDSQDPRWTDASVEKNVSGYLGKRRQACMDIMELIKIELQRVDEWDKDLRGVLESGTAPPKSSSSFSLKRWGKTAVTNAKFTFSGPQLSAKIGRLRYLNRDFETLVDQNKNIAGQSYTLVDPSSPSPEQISRFKLIQQTSTALHLLLEDSCEAHPEHITLFSLKPMVQDMTAGVILYKLTFERKGSQSNLGPEASFIWLLVESPGNRSESDRSTNDLRRQRKLCIEIEAYSRQENPPERKCVGFLKNDTGKKYFVYLESPKSTAESEIPASLNNLLESSSPNVTSPMKLSKYDRVHLARLLATVVLEFHSTPWLKEGRWRSHDICVVQGSTPVSSSPALGEPYINVMICRRPNASPSLAATRRRNPYIRNPLLFGLALIMTELAFQKSAYSMQLPSDLQDGPENFEIYFAQRACEILAAEMGSTYKRIVEKCFFCDFSVGSDLTQPELERRFFSDVVCELERLEKLLFQVRQDFSPSAS